VEARAVEVDLKIKHGAHIYDVYLNNGTKVSVDAKSGTIMKVIPAEADN
jgi:uncharacterized membrane protein YkoI